MTAHVKSNIKFIANSKARKCGYMVGKTIISNHKMTVLVQRLQKI